MRVGKPFKLKEIANAGDIFVRLTTVCRTCKRKFKITIPDALAIEGVYGSRTLECMAHDNAWTDCMEILGDNVSGIPTRRVSFNLEDLL